MSKIIWANLARRSRAFNRFLRFWRSGETSFPGLTAISQRQFENQPRSTKGFIGRGPKHRSIALGRVSASRYLSMRGNVITVSSFSTLCLHSCFLHSANCNPPPPLPDCATRLCSRCSPARDSHSTYLSPPLSLSVSLRLCSSSPFVRYIATESWLDPLNGVYGMRHYCSMVYGEACCCVAPP